MDGITDASTQLSCSRSINEARVQVSACDLELKRLKRLTSVRRQGTRS